MVEKIRELNRVRLVTAAFSAKFLRAPDPTELACWLNLYRSNPDFKLLLIQLNIASTDGRFNDTTIESKPQLSAANNFTAADNLVQKNKNQNKLYTEANLLGGIHFNDANLVLNAGENYHIKVNIVNDTSATWQTSEKTPIYISYHWYFENGNLCEWDGKRTALAMPVKPSENLEQEINIQAPGELGNLLLELTMIMEGEFWFEQRGFRACRVAAQIETPKLSPYAYKIFRDMESMISKYKSEKS